MNDVRAELAAAEAAEAEALADAARATALAGRLRSSPPVRRPALRRVPAVLGAGVLAGLLVGLIALMVWQHHRANAQRAHDGAFIEAARAGVVALLSIDHNRARADVQRVLDLSTGDFRADFESRADDFVETAEKSKAVTKGSVSAAALESVQPDKAVVLVAAASQVTNANGARDDPRPWRMSVTVTRDGGQLKMSDVEFVP